MIDVARTATIARPVAEVWRVLADFGGIGAWATNVDHSCLMQQQSEGVGITRRIQAGPLTLLETVVTWEPHRSLAYQLHGLPPIVKSATNTWTLEANGEYTVVTLTSRVNAGPRPPQELIARVVARRLATGSGQMLAGLSGHLLAQARP